MYSQPQFVCCICADGVIEKKPKAKGAKSNIRPKILRVQLVSKLLGASIFTIEYLGCQ
jgi:hypothetical protein